MKLYSLAWELGNFKALEDLIYCYKYYTEIYNKERANQLCEEALLVNKTCIEAIECLIYSNYRCQRKENCTSCIEAVKLCDDAIKLGEINLIETKSEIIRRCPHLLNMDTVVELDCELIKKKSDVSNYYYKGLDYTLLAKKYNSLKEQLEELKKENEQLKTQIEYMPGGEGYYKALDHFKGFI